MPTAYTHNMNQQATWWSRGANDGYGGYAYGAPALITCRWENKTVLFRDQQGREVVSTSIVYVDSELSNGDYLAQGDLTGTANPLGSELAKEVRGFNSSPSLDATRVLYKAML